MQREKAVFLAEMAGVTPLPKDPRGRVEKPQALTPKPFYPTDDYEALADLRDLVEGRGEQVTPLPNLTGVAPGVLLVTPAIALPTADAFAAFDAGGPAAPPDPHSTRISSEHLVAELRGGLSGADLVVRAGVLAAANDLAAAAFHLVPGLLQLRRRMSRILGVSIGLSGSGPTLWALYPSLDDARNAEDALEGAFRRGDLEAPGPGAPTVSATELGGPPA